MGLILGMSVAQQEQQESADWNDRSTAPGVVFALNFDSQSEVDANEDGSPLNVSWETDIKKSGNGSLRIDVLDSDSTLSGEYARYLFPGETSLQSGDEIYIQYRQYIPAYLIDHLWEGSRSGGGETDVSQGFKSSITSNVAGSNQNSETVIQNSLQMGWIEGYHQDGVVTAVKWEQSQSTPCSGSDFRKQPSIDRDPGNSPSTCDDAIAKYGGLFTEGAYNQRPNPISGAFAYHKHPGVGNWVTIYQRLKIDPSGQTNGSNEWQVWAAYDGDTSYTELVDQTIDLGGTEINAVWLVLYRSDGSSNVGGRRETYTLYDELIISTDPIDIPAETATDLSTLAAGMAVGEFAELSTLNFDNDLLLTNGQHLFQYSDNLKYDYLLKQVHFVGAGVNPVAAKHIVYDLASNAWSERSLSGTSITARHGYDHMAIDVDGRQLFYRQYNEDRFHVYDLDDQSWTQGTGHGLTDQVVGAAFFSPDLGLACFFDERIGLQGYDPIADSWQEIADDDTFNENSAGTPIGTIHQEAEWSTAAHVALMGGGNGSAGMYVMDKDGVVTDVTDAPFVVTTAGDSTLTHDPVTGDFLLIDGNTGDFYSYAPGSDTWTDLGITVPADLMNDGGTGNFGLVATPVPEYGVTMFANHNEGDSVVYLYKHADFRHE